MIGASEGMTEGEKLSAANVFPGWESYIPLFVHPVKVAIVEALSYIGEPLSVPQLGKLLRGTGLRVSEQKVRFHLKCLIEIGMLEVTTSIPVEGRNVCEHYHFFVAGSPQAGQ